MVKLQTGFEAFQDWFAWAFEFLSQFHHFLDGLSQFGDVGQVQAIIFFNQWAEMLFMVAEELIDNFVYFVFHGVEYFDIVLNNLFEWLVGHDSFLVFFNFA